jgi:YD repeat-containing protein
MVLLLCGLICAIPAFADTATYNYDAMNRLTQVKYTDGTTIKYTYDKMGNRLTETVLASIGAAAEPPEQAPAPAGPPLPLRALPSPAQLK